MFAEERYSECRDCGTLHECSPGFSCLWCGGQLVTVRGRSDRIALLSLLELEAHEDPDQRPYSWETDADD